jgi:hypothetical protein
MVKCNEIGCDKQAVYGLEYKSPLKCLDHRIKPQMKDVLRK